MSDLTLPLIALTTLVGYFFSKDGRNSRNTESVREGVEEFDKPNGKNIYTSNVVDQANTEILNRSLQNYKAAETPSETGYIPPHFNSYGMVGSNKLVDVGLSSEQLGGLNDINRIKNVFDEKKKVLVEDKPMFKSLIGDGVQTNYIGKDISEFGDSQINVLTGEPFEGSHNNMLPFFGSNVKQNMEMFSNESLLDKYSGNVSTFRHKEEIGSLYDKKPENIYGNQVFSSSVDMTRYIPSNYRQNEKPVEPERISAPKAGTYENNIRPSFKDVNDLRPGNRPKETYDGRTLSGKMGETRGIIGKLEKNRADTYFENDYRFSGPGQYVAPEMKRDFSNMKKSSRQDYNAEYYGIQTSANKSSTSRIKTIDNSDELAAVFQEPKRNNFENDYGRNLNGTIINSQSGHDYGRSGITIYEQERVTTGDNVHVLNANIEKSGVKVRHQDEAKTTTRETLQNVDNSGNISSTYKVSSNVPYILGISDVMPKQTAKETMVKNKYKGQIYKNDGMGYVVNKYEAKVTGKQILSESMKDYVSNPVFTSESESRTRFDNVSIRDHKQDVIMGERPSGPQSFHTSSGKDSFGETKITDNMLLKESIDNRDKLMTDYIVTPTKEQIGLVMKYRADDEAVDTVVSDRLQPDLVHGQLQNNPYLIKNKGII